MKLVKLALIPIFLLVLNSCATCEPRVEYVDRIITIKPDVPDVMPTELPSVELRVWGDYSIYKAQCETLIGTCNADKKSIMDSLRN